jgi:hypothetical protein
MAVSVVSLGAVVAVGVGLGAATTPASGGTLVDAAVLQTPSASLSDEEVANLRYLREEEYLAHDVYVVLGRQYRLPVFATIADSELRHTAAVEGLLDKYGIDDPADSHRLGEFTDPTLQALFDELTTRGKTSLRAALKVGVFIERTDLADLADAIDTSTAADVDDVLKALRAGSRNHLAAFRYQLDQLG